MGGHAAGELASASAIAVFSALDSTEPPIEELPEALQGALERVGEELDRVTTDDPALTGLGTTLTSISWRDGRAIVTHVGDSRAYLLRDGELQRLTRDHTYVQALVDAGRITEAQAAAHPQRSLITRALDGRRDVEGDFSIRELRAGDRLLVCSDGLTGVVSDSRLAELLGEGDPTGAVTTLVDAALAGGASDNVTVVVADVVESRVLSGAPVVVGAAGEPGNRDRLPALDFPTDVQPGGKARLAASRDRSRRTFRIIALVLAIIAGLAIIAAVGVSWLSHRYYVGVDGGHVAIFRGIDAAIGPVQFSKPEHVTDIAVASLSEFERQRVEESIPVAGLKEAESTVQSIRDRTPCTGANCPSPSPSPVMQPSPGAS
jgi:protein phosphatase